MVAEHPFETTEEHKKRYPTLNKGKFLSQPLVQLNVNFEDYNLLQEFLIEPSKTATYNLNVLKELNKFLRENIKWSKIVDLIIEIVSKHANIEVK